MSRAGGIIAALRPATVIAAGAFAVHQLGYVAGYGGGASHALEQHGHAYLTALLPVLAVLFALTLLAAIEGGVSGIRTGVPTRSPLLRASTYAASILAVFAVQEIAEGLLVAGHPGALGLLASPVGLVAAPLALAFGSLARLAVRGLEAVEGRISARFDPAAAPRASRHCLR
ncbi:MAG: hypothetical protein ACRDL1_10040, partial [Solirubrobacterales bacterium]